MSGAPVTFAALLGVGIERCSSMHAAESIPIPDAITADEAIPTHVRQAYNPQEWSIGYGVGTPDDAWQKVWQAADQQGLIRHEQIGAATCHCCKARALVGIYKHWRRSDPYGLYGVRPGSFVENTA